MPCACSGNANAVRARGNGGERRVEAGRIVPAQQPQIDLRLEIGERHDVERIAQRAAFDERLRHQSDTEAVRDALQLQVAAVGVERDRHRQALRVERAPQARTKPQPSGLSTQPRAWQSASR